MCSPSHILTNLTLPILEGPPMKHSSFLLVSLGILLSVLLPHSSTAQNFVELWPGLFPAVSSGTILSGDYDNSGNMSVFIFGSGTSQLFYNTGSGFQAVPSGSPAIPGVSYSAAAWGDYDNDGNIDVAVSGLRGSSCRLLVFRNKGDGTFDTNQVKVLPGWGLQSASIAFCDFDNDGDLDLAVAGQDYTGNDIFRVFKNKEAQMSNVNTAPASPAGLTALYAYDGNKATITLCWTPGQYDVGHSSNSVYYNVVLATFPMTLSGDGLRIATAGHFVMPWDFGTPNLGNFMRPAAKQWRGAIPSVWLIGRHALVLKRLPLFIPQPPLSEWWR